MLYSNRRDITYLDNQFKIVYLNGNESKTYFISLKNENVTNETYFGNYNLLYENKDKELLPFNMIINVSPWWKQIKLLLIAISIYVIIN